MLVSITKDKDNNWLSMDEETLRDFQRMWEGVKLKHKVFCLENNIEFPKYFEPYFTVIGHEVKYAPEIEHLITPIDWSKVGID